MVGFPGRRQSRPVACRTKTPPPSTRALRKVGSLWWERTTETNTEAEMLNCWRGQARPGMQHRTCMMAAELAWVSVAVCRQASWDLFQLLLGARNCSSGLQACKPVRYTRASQPGPGQASCAHPTMHNSTLSVTAPPVTSLQYRCPHAQSESSYQSCCLHPSSLSELP